MHWFKIILVPLLLSIYACQHRAETKKVRPYGDFQRAEYYDYYLKKDSAFYYYNKVIHNTADSVEKATAFFKMGLSQLAAGDYYSAQESLLSSIKTLNEKDPSHYPYISSDYNALANATLNLKNYDAAFVYYDQAFRFATDDDARLYLMNNRGVAFQKKGDLNKAIQIFDSALLQPTLDTSLKAMLISNRYRTKWLADNHFMALPGFMKALALRLQIQDSLGMNASFAHISDYYEKTRPDSAFHYALKRLAIAEALDDPYDILEGLNQLIRVSPPQKNKLYLDRYFKLDDSLSDVRSRDRNQFALIKFDAEKSKADNLILEKHVGRQRLIIVGTALLGFIIILSLILWARSRRKRLKLQAEKMIQESQLKTSQKVHDVVANGLYLIMNELEHVKEIEREPLLDKIEALYEKSRDISYENPQNGNADYSQKISELVNSFSNGAAKVFLTGNDRSLWDRVTSTQKHELELILKEIMVNMEKHSDARQVVITFKTIDDRAHIEYRDDGHGFTTDQKFGNGLNNTVYRIQSIKGEISFGENGQAGTSIHIIFPLESIKT